MSGAVSLGAKSNGKAGKGESGSISSEGSSSVRDFGVTGGIPAIRMIGGVERGGSTAGETETAGMGGAVFGMSSLTSGEKSGGNTKEGGGPGRVASTLGAIASIRVDGTPWLEPAPFFVEI